MKVEGKIYDDAQDMTEVMNNCFRSVFTVEGEFDAERGKLVRNILNTVPVSYEEIFKMMEELDVNKATGPDGVSKWILKECRELADKIQSSGDITITGKSTKKLEESKYCTNIQRRK